MNEFKGYVDGDLTASDILSEAFLMHGTIPNCSPNGKYMTKGFLFDLLNMHFSPKHKAKVESTPSVSIGSIPCESFIGFKNKTCRFRANLQFVCAVLNFILTHSPLDWAGLDQGELLDANRNFRRTAENIYSQIKKVATHKRKSKDEKAVYLGEIFDPSCYFSSCQLVKRPRLEDETNVNCFEHVLMKSKEPISAATPTSQIKTRNAHASTSTTSSNTRMLTVRAGTKRKHSSKVTTSQGRVNFNTRHKIPVWRTTYKSKISQIAKLRHQVADLKVQASNANTAFVEGALAAAREEYVEKIASLEETINEYELELEKRGGLIDELKRKYQNLKDDYESEAFKHEEEVSSLVEKLSVEEASENLSQLSNLFDADHIPQIKLRIGLKNINPHILKILCILKLAVGLSLRKCIMCLVLVGNHVFNQKWSLPKNKEYKQNARSNRCMPAPLESNKDQDAAAVDESIDDFTAPAPSYLKKIIETIIEPNSLGSIFAELKDSNTEYSTISADHFVEHRQKKQTQNLMTSKIDPYTGKSTVGYRCLGLTNVFKTNGEATCDQIKRIFQLGAILSAKSNDADDILCSLQQILAKVKYSVTDGASSMKNAMENFSDWRTEMTGITGDFLWIHCNAHVLPALTGATEKYLKAVEKMLQLKMYACQEFNKFFFKVSDSVVITIFNAIFRNVGPSSKNQEYACTTQFHAYLKNICEPLNRFFDPQSARFGKETEMGMIIAYNFKILKSFFQCTYMPNALFKACELYMSCPMLYEISIAMTCTYYHLLGPFKIACGADKLEGYKNKRLSHQKLLKFYKAFVKTLEELATDPTPLLKINTLANLAEFDLSLFTKSHLGIVSFVVEELETNDDINVDVVKSVLKLACEEYFIAINRQVDEFYIRDGSIIEKALAADEHALDNVPTTSLAAERSVALARASFKVAPNASTRTHSNLQMINTAPFFPKFVAMNANQITQMIQNTKKSDLSGIVKKFIERNHELEQQALKGTVDELVKKRDEHAQSRTAICQDVKSHGGPFQSPGEVEQFCRNFVGTNAELGKVIAAELKFQKVIINNRSVNPDLYKCREKDKSTGDGKYRTFTVHERIDNLKEIVSPLPEEIKFPEINTSEFVKQVEAHHSTLKSYPHRRKNATDPSTAGTDDPVQISDTVTYIAAYFVGEERLWYPGIVTKFIDSKSCESCKTLEGIEGLNNNCSMAKFMTPIGLDLYEITDIEEYHVHPSQLIMTPTIEYVQLEHGGLGYKVLNYLQIDDSVKNNQLYLCLQGSATNDTGPQNKGKQKKRKRTPKN